MRKIILLLSIIIWVDNLSFAQFEVQQKIDSLLLELPKMKDDTNAVTLLADLSLEYYGVNPNLGIKYGEEGLEIAQKIKWKKGEALILNSLGKNLIWKSDYNKALDYLNNAIKINEHLGIKIGIAANLSNIGLIYFDQSNYPIALKYCLISLKLNEEIKNKSGILINLGNIGIIYKEQSDYKKALEYFLKALKISEEIGLKAGIARNLSNIGHIYKEQLNYPKALEYLFKSLKIAEEIGLKYIISMNLRNIGLTYDAQLNYNKASEYYFKSLNISEEMELKSVSLMNLGNLGGLYLIQSKNYKIHKTENLNEQLLNRNALINNSINYLTKSINICKEIGELNYQSQNLYYLSQAYELKGDCQKSFDTFKEFKLLQDSVFSKDKQKEIAKLEAKRENELIDKEIKILQSENKAQQFQSYLLGGGVIVLLGAFGIAFIRFREKKKLSDKLAIQNTEIENQKLIVEEKNEQIVASITYASTIQSAILPWESTLKLTFGEILIFYKPKDIVSGDSYWFKEIEGIKFLAVIDCTGHGIPGAMLTVIASSVLDDAVLGKHIFDTGQILTYMNEKVTEVLNQRLAENKIRDGMEVALIAIHPDKVQFSGAGRPLFCKNETFETIKTDKRGIAGQTENDEYQFSSIEIEKTENMMLYLSSDGFADQMNEHSKKYSTKKFVALLDSISEKPISEQQIILENEFNSHKGERSQIDDVTILGVRL